MIGLWDFFPRGHSNQSCNPISSWHSLDFPIYNPGYGKGGKVQDMKTFNSSPN